jgi:dihydrofolate synthase/folylpolyglutamate synthase
MILVGRDYRWEQRPEGLRVVGHWGQYGGLRLPLLGDHQLVNAATAVATIDVLRSSGVAVPTEVVREGIAGVHWPGRLEVLRRRPLIVTDGAHNADSAQKLALALRENFAFRRIHLILGTSSDKDIAGIVTALAPLVETVVLVRSQHPRAASFEAMEAEVRRHTHQIIRASSVGEAMDLARSRCQTGDLICATGSLFVAAEAREAMGLRSIYERYRPRARCVGARHASPAA